MLPEEASYVVNELRARDVFAHLVTPAGGATSIRVVLPDGREALWDAGGAAGLEAQILDDGDLVGFISLIPGSAQFTPDEVVLAIESADYGAR